MTGGETAAEILKKVIYVTVATSSLASQPWNSPVYVVYDDEMRFYWASAKASQHSTNIRENPNVFLAIYDSTVSWGMGIGVFIQATAVEVEDPDVITKACELRKKRTPDAKHPPEEFMNDRPRRIYCATPQKVWINKDANVNGFFVDERQEVDIALLRELLFV